jgi:putative RecB family exonuclease
VALPRNLSPSAIETLRQCPLKFKWEKIDRLPRTQSPEGVLGTFAHEVLEVLFGKSAPERTIDAARAIAKRLWTNKYTNEALAAGVTDHSTFMWQVWWCVENYFKLEDPTTVHPKGTEQWLRSPISGVPMVGIVDRWHIDDDGLAVITDYKTGKVPRRAEWAAPKVEQLTIYADMATTELSVSVGRVELLYLKEGVVKSYTLADFVPPGADEDYFITPDDIANMRSSVVAAWDEVRSRCDSGDFPARPSRLCDWCSYKKDCPAWR